MVHLTLDGITKDGEPLQTHSNSYAREERSRFSGRINDMTRYLYIDCHWGKEQEVQFANVKSPIELLSLISFLKCCLIIK